MIEMLKMYNYEQSSDFEINVLNKNSIKQIEVDIFNKFKSDWCSRVSSSVEGCKLRTYKL
jgi:hypothetical protein